MGIYIPHIVKLTSNVLITLVLTEQDCFEELFETANVTRWISEFIWQWVPDRRIVGKARWLYVLSWQHGAVSWCWLVEHSQCWDATLMAGVMCLVRYQGACLCRQWYIAKELTS